MLPVTSLAVERRPAMKKRSNSQKNKKPRVKTKGIQERVTIGMDLGDKTSRYCMLSSEGEILREGKSRLPKLGWWRR
jgi:hypothetical protein